MEDLIKVLTIMLTMFSVAFLGIAGMMLLIRFSVWFGKFIGL